ARSLEGKSPAVALPGVLASTVVNNPAKLAGIGAGTIKGEIRDSAARPVPFALVQVHGLGMARTNAQGQYAFVNVPVGAYQVTVRQSGMKPKSSQVIVTVGASSTSQIQFAPADALVSSHASLLQAGAGTSLRGIVLDEEAHPLAGAKILVTQSETAVSVVTAQDGTYELRNLKPGSYRVSAYKLR